MTELTVPARQTPLTKHAPFQPPFHPNVLEPESEYPGIWDWTPRADAVWQAAEARNAPLKARRPLGGSEGIPETQPDTNDLLNVALTVIAGLSLGVVVTTILRVILPRN
ncbi:MAG: hypothetical protein NVV72_09100 [Asticcacaulis sp.]|nr:hypothetical protein [Asticcacaulis sp.]